MDRRFFLDLAATGLRMPIGTDLVLREKPDHEAIIADGGRLGQVIVEAAERYQTPLAIPLMDLTLEKSALLNALDIPTELADTFHFAGCPGEAMIQQAERRLAGPLYARLQAHVDAVAWVAGRTRLVPVGMCIGPFSLMTRLIADPISPVFMAGQGTRAEEDEEVRATEQSLALAMRVVLRSIDAQLEAGARAIMIAEPAANKAYFSPNQLAAGSDVFDRYVMSCHRRIRQRLRDAGADLLFHCCGELTDGIVRQFASLDPAILSLGSSRRLWEDAAIVPKDVVLYGNLPTKKFFSDEMISTEQVQSLTCELVERMAQAKHPFILGSECDVLSVHGYEESIRAKLGTMLSCRCA